MTMNMPTFDEIDGASAQAAHHWWSGPDSFQSPVSPAQYAVSHALYPLRRKHYAVNYINRQRCCVTCYDDKGKPAIWPCEVASFIWPEWVIQKQSSYVY